MASAGCHPFYATVGIALCASVFPGCGQGDSEASKKRDQMLVDIGALRTRVEQLEKTNAEQAERLKKLQDDLAVEKQAKEALSRDMDRINARSISDKFDVDGLTALMRSPDPEICRSAIFIARKTGDERLFRALIALAREDRDVSVRRTAAEALAAIPHPDARKALVDLLADPNPSVSTVAAYGLSTAREPEVTAHLLRALETIAEPDTKTVANELRRTILEGLGRLGDRRAFPALLKQIGSPNDTIAQTAANALRGMADESVAPALAEWLKAQPAPKAGEPAPVHVIVLQTLSKVGDQKGGAIVMPLLECPNAQVAEAACAALPRVCGLADTQLLLQALKKELVTDARGGAQHYLAAVIRALGQTGSPRAAAALLSLLAAGAAPGQTMEMVAALRTTSHPCIADKLAEAYSKVKDGRAKAEIQKILATEGYPAKFDEAAKKYTVDEEALKRIRESLPKEFGGSKQEF